MPPGSAPAPVRSARGGAGTACSGPRSGCLWMPRPPARRARRGRLLVLLAAALRSRCPISTSSSQGTGFSSQSL
eukprot:14318963-Alexandrium_andersonii.AAC.1